MVDIQLEAADVLNFASAVNKIPIVYRLDLKNTAAADLHDLVIVFEAAPALIRPNRINVSQIAAGQHYVLETVSLQADNVALGELNESQPVLLTVTIRCGDKEVGRSEVSIEAAAYEQWPGDRLMPQLLAAFSQPNTKATAGIQKNAAQLLRSTGKQLCGYQAKERGDVALQVSAIYAAIGRMKLDYANPPAGLIEYGQRIRTPARVVHEGLATCLDTVMLMASVLESVGLHPVLLLAREHAWIACWLIQDSLNETCTGDAQVVRKRITSGEMIAIETTLLCGADRGKFKTAVSRGADRLDPERYDDFCYAIDISRARHQKIGPLPAPGESLVDEAPEAVDEVECLEEDPLVLPPIDEEADSAVYADAKETSARIEQWKSQLLDYTMRNRLLNCDPGKHTLRFFHPDPGAVEDILADGKALYVDSIMKHAVADDPRSEALLSRQSDRSYQEELALHAFNRKRLVCLHDTERSRHLLTKLYRDARNNEAETGSNTLYLCIGALSWRPAGKSKDYMAPLLMLPMQLKRASVGADFRLVRHDDDPILNPTLLQVLREQFAIQIPEIAAPHALPTDDSGVDVPRLLGLVNKAVTEQPHMEVRPDVVQLGNYSFAKYLLWMDLANKTEDLLKHPLINLMVEAKPEAAEALHRGEFLDRNEIDQKLDVGDLKLVTKADASQMIVIHEAAQGRSFVCEGPPGTGKSETITNVIADQLSRGRRVLFVSEKMEALDVVHTRLCEVGLEPFLMVLHAARASKKGVIEQYRRAVEAANAHQPSGWEELRDRLRQRRDQLNEYVRVLHTPQAPGLTVHQAITVLAKHPDWVPAPLSWPSVESVDKEHRQRLRDAARNMGVLAGELGGLAEQPLAGIHATRFTPAWRDDLLECAARYTAAFDAMHPMFLDLAAELKVPGLRWTPAGYKHVAALLRALVDPPAVMPQMASGTGAGQVCDALAEVGTVVARRRQLSEALAEEWIEDVLKLDAEDFKLRWRAAMGRMWPFSWFAKFGLRGQLKPYAKNSKRPPPGQVLDVLEQIANVHKADESLAGLRSNAEALLGQFYRGVDTDTALVNQARNWLTAVDAALVPLIPGEAARWEYLQLLIGLATQRRDELASTGAIGRRCQDALAAKAAHDEALNSVCEAAARQVDDAVPPDKPHALQAWADEARSWRASIKRLQPWCVWRKSRSEALEVGLGPLVEALEAGHLDPSQFEAYFDFSFANWWMNQMVGCTPLLQQFSRPLHEKTIAEFRELDEQFIQATREMIFASLAANVPRPDINIPGSPMGFLRDQMTRQRGHKPVREIMQRLGDQNQRLKPCMMMSPLTVAQYLDVAETQFDVVVFDEASQIKTCDAVGVIARAPQVIVVGDSKQLPPTSFFATGNQDGDGDSEDHESILDECAAVLPSHRLCWHYRSRNEELIAFSNARYYDGELISMPAPTTEKSVTLHKVDGVYDRGRSRTNRVEAEAVIDFIRSRVLAPGTRRQSVGVVTFSAAQQTLIEDLRDRACGDSPALENAVKGAYNDEHKDLFVKNLESVQGDQRDVIVFSICYGRTASGVVYNDFGPVNRPGGQRRLNVAVTRAAEEVHVFSSMDPEDIKSAYLQAEESGAGDLKRYLMFTRDGVGALETYSSPTGRGPDSEFEQQVMKRLVDKGWDVHLQVGVSKFRIDLAIVDPRKPGRYLAGVECDGATYHSSATARDRDIVRQGVLERLGWQLLRIWSTDWWSDADAEVTRIHDELTKLRDQPIAEAAEVDADFDPGSVPEATADDADAEEESGPEAESEPQASSGMSAANDPESMRLRARSDAEPVHKQYPLYTPPPVPRLSDDLYTFNSRAIAVKAAEEILKHVAPMRQEHLFRCVLEAFGQSRLTRKASETLTGYLAGVPQTAEPGGRVFWESAEQAKAYRGFRVGEARAISDIPVIELANLSSDVLRNAIQCPKAELGRAVANLLGIKRLGNDVQSHLEAAQELLVVQGRAEVFEDGQIRHVTEPLE